MPVANPLTKPTQRVSAETEPLYVVLVHNDDVTPFDFVISVLVVIFDLSEELADHIAGEAHHRGVAPVITRPRGEALALIDKAHTIARTNGFPLTFSAEPQD